MSEKREEVSVKKEKEFLMNSVVTDTIEDVQRKFIQCKLIQDESFFDYELLKAALRRKEKTIVNFLLNLGCRVRNPSKIISEETPLYLAIKLEDLRIVKDMLTNGASIYDKNKNGETTIHAGFKEGYHHIVNQTLNFFFINSYKHPEASKNPDSKNEDDILHFHIAIILNNLFAVVNFLNNGFDANSSFGLKFGKISGLNPLHYNVMYNYALQEKYSNMFILLVRHGADLSIKNCNGQTPLHVLYYSGGFGLNMISSAFDCENESKFINSVDDNSVSHFHLCCIVNKPDAVKVFIDNGADINSAISLSCSIYPGFTALHFAVMHEYHEIVELLLKNGADCNKADAQGSTPLHLACKKGYSIGEKIIQTLLEHGASPAAVDQKGFTPLHLAFYSKVHLRRPIILDNLISKIPSKVNITDKQGLSYFHIVCARGDTSTNKTRVQDFLESGSVTVDSCVVSGLYSGYTALHFAVLFSQCLTAKLLLKKNAQVNIKTSEFQFTPLHLACKFEKSKLVGQLDLIKSLLQYNANVNDKTKNSETPLQIFIENIDRTCLWECQLLNHLSDILTTLLENGSDVNARNKYGKTMLQIAMKEGLIFVIKKLLYYVADLNNLKYLLGDLPRIENIYNYFEIFEINNLSNLLVDLSRLENIHNYVKIFEITLTHMQKLLALGYYVNGKVKTVCIKLLQNYQTSALFIKRSIINFDKVFDNYIQELERMKLVKVDNYTSLYSILLKNTHELSKHVKNSSLIKIIEDPKTYENFPFYSVLLKVAFKKALFRNAVLESAKKSLPSIIGLSLPEPCYDSIYKYLTNEEIANLKAADMRNSFKRKLNNDNTSEMQPSTKLQKKL